MHLAHRYVSALFLTAALAASPTLVSARSPQEASVQVKVYDPNHHDYHNWDEHEDHAYRSYLTEHHQAYRPYNKQKHNEQNDYWKWRHSHPD